MVSGDDLYIDALLVEIADGLRSIFAELIRYNDHSDRLGIREPIVFVQQTGQKDTFPLPDPKLDFRRDLRAQFFRGAEDQHPPIGQRYRRIFSFGRKRRAVNDLVGFCGGVLKMREQSLVGRVVVFSAGQIGGHQPLKLRFVDLRGDVFDHEAALGERACFVQTNHVAMRQIFQGMQFAHQHVLLRKPNDPDRETDADEQDQTFGQHPQKTGGSGHHRNRERRAAQEIGLQEQ